jgi:Cu-Zn family superoxide dismutase
MTRQDTRRLIRSGACAFGVLIAPLALAQAGQGKDKAGDVFGEATLKPTQGQTASGTVVFSKVADGVAVKASFTSAPPGEHGFHIHEKGDCSAPDGSSAGGHYNPTNAPHGAPNASSSHVGDLGNVEIGKDGSGTASYVIKQSAHPDFSNWDDLVGRAVILHGGEDDLSSQPSGDAGSRIACGVIEKVETGKTTH